MEVIAEALRRRGYSATSNDPFIGAESVRLHSDPANGIHSARIETIKDIFMDDYSFVKRPDFDRIRQDLGGVAAGVAAMHGVRRADRRPSRSALGDKAD